MIAVCLPVNTQVTHVLHFGIFHVTATVIGMGSVQFTDHFTNDKIGFFACECAFQHAQVTVTDSRPVNAMHFSIVEIISFESPGIHEDLFPFFNGIHHHLHFVGADWLFEFLVLRCIDYGKTVLPADQHLLFIMREHKKIRIFQHRFFFSFINIKIFDAVPCACIACIGKTHVKDLSLAGFQVSIITWLYRQ